jgi:hypothetical protein
MLPPTQGGDWRSSTSENPYTWGLAPMTMHNSRARVYKIRVLSKQKPTLKRQILCSTNIKTQLSHTIHTGRSCSFLTPAAMMGAQMGEMPKLGWLIGWSTRDMVYCISCRRCSVQSAGPSLLSDIFCGLLRMHVGIILIFRETLGQDAFVLLNAYF